MHRLGAVLFSMLFVAAACAERAGSNALEADVVPTTSTPGPAATETTVGVVEMYDSLEELGPERDIDIDGEYADIDPIEDDPVWRCGEASLGLDQLADFEALAEPSAEVFAGAEQFTQLGESASWVQLSERWIADRRLLDTSPPAVLLGDVVYGGAQGCVPTRATWMRPVAWEQVGEAIDGSVSLAIESCVDPLDVVSDARTLGVDVLVGLFTPTGSSGTSCLVDGSTTLQLPVDLGDDGSLLASQTWPFAPGDPSTFLTLQAHPSTAPVTPAELDGVECSVSGGAADLYVEYLGIPRGLTATFFVDGEPWLDHEANRNATTGAIWRAADARLVEYGNESWERSGFDGGYSFFGPDPGRVYEFELRIDADGGERVVVPCGKAAIAAEVPGGDCVVREVAGAPLVSVSAEGVAPTDVTILRNGELIDLGLQLGGPLDVTAQPGVAYEYEAVVADPLRQRDPATVSCGTFTLVPPADDLERLRDAQERFRLLGGGAHYYLTVVTPEGREIDAAMAWDGASYAFIAPEAPPIGADPHTIHQRLIDAVEAGRDVTFEIDRWVGVVTSWSIDGDPGFDTLCLNWDTAPLELRDITCNPAVDLIGKRSL